MAFDDFKPDWNNEVQNLRITQGFWIKGWSDRFPFPPDFLLLNLSQARLWQG